MRGRGSLWVCGGHMDMERTCWQVLHSFQAARWTRDMMGVGSLGAAHATMWQGANCGEFAGTHEGHEGQSRAGSSTRASYLCE